MNELINLTKRYLEEEYSHLGFVLADLDTCNYFRGIFKKPRPIATVPPPPPPKKVEIPVAKPFQTVDQSEFKKLMAEHFPQVLNEL